MLLEQSAQTRFDFDDFAQLGVDAGFVTTPDCEHASIAIDLLHAGIAVSLEKPLAITREEADAVLIAACESGTRPYIGHNMRHMPVVRIMRDLIRAGEIGEVKAVWCRHFAMGELSVFDQASDRRDNRDHIMSDWFSLDNWPPLAQTELNPIIDVEEISMVTKKSPYRRARWVTAETMQ